MARTIEIVRDNLREHPAVQAWRALEPERVEPQMIAVFKTWKRKKKSGVYRLAGVGPGGSAVVAKRCLVKTAAVERAIYEEFLPRLPLPTLGYYGCVEDADGQSWWLFLEEATGDLYSPLNPEHRALAARWLAAVHNAGLRQEWRRRLPDRSPEQYLQLLQSCRVKAREHLTDATLSPDGAAVLSMVLKQCDVLEAHWSELEKICEGLPRMVVHGDFVTKNVRVRPSAHGPLLLVFDWEFASWGVPSTDLAQFVAQTIRPDLAVYHSCLEGWPEIGDYRRILRLAEWGSCLRLLDDMKWTSSGMRLGWPAATSKPIACLAIYTRLMDQVLSAAGWTTHD
jgi:hypothetical protein